MRHTITLLPGDGIGPEVVEATIKVIEATGIDVAWDRQLAGMDAYEEHGEPLPQSVVDSIETNTVALKGPITTPVGKGFQSVNVRLRQELDLYANVRPCKSLPGIKTPFEDVELVILRENIEGLYSGIESYDERLQIADATARITRQGSERFIRFAFEYVRSHGYDQLTLVHKANILKLTSGLFLDIGRETAEEYPDITFNDRIVDNMCMQLVMRPTEYSCIVTTNLFGDILSDLGAGLIGGLGIAAGANIGEEYAIFEAVHGSAPDIAGEGKANPTALIRSAVMMLEHVDEKPAANAIERAVVEQYREGECLTPDVGGSCSTSEFSDVLARRVADYVTA
jgi:isocitrate dehydrogenase (NAD+)